MTWVFSEDKGVNFFTHAHCQDSPFFHTVIPYKTMLMWDDNGEA